MLVNPVQVFVVRGFSILLQDNTLCISKTEKRSFYKKICLNYKVLYQCDAFFLLKLGGNMTIFNFQILLNFSVLALSIT